jgi:hypothetical protein
VSPHNLGEDKGDEVPCGTDRSIKGQGRDLDLVSDCSFISPCSTLPGVRIREPESPGLDGRAGVLKVSLQTS